MIFSTRFGIAKTLWLAFFLSLTQHSSICKLTIKQEGVDDIAPNRIMLSFEKRSLQVFVHDGKFEVPSEVADAQKVAFTVDVKGDQLRIADIPGKKFVGNNWTILLAKHAYSEDYQWIVPKGVDIHDSCILVFTPDEGDGTAMFVPHCRVGAK